MSLLVICFFNYKKFTRFTRVNRSICTQTKHYILIIERGEKRKIIWSPGKQNIVNAVQCKVQ